MLRHISLAAAVSLLLALSTQNVHARGGGHAHHHAMGGGGSGYFAPNPSSGSAMSSPTTSRRASRAAKKYASTSTSSTTATNATPFTNGSWSSRHKSNASSSATTNTPSSATATNTGLQTPAVGTTGINPLGLLPYARSLDPNVSAQRTYGYLLRNAKYLIQAGLYGPASNYLQRIIAGAPGTRIANEAQRLLSRMPVI
jgi:hypothetical protein